MLPCYHATVHEPVCHICATTACSFRQLPDLPDLIFRLLEEPERRQLSKGRPAYAIH
jgi:hypothetical protein